MISKESITGNMEFINTHLSNTTMAIENFKKGILGRRGESIIYMDLNQKTIEMEIYTGREPYLMNCIRLIPESDLCLILANKKMLLVNIQNGTILINQTCDCNLNSFVFYNSNKLIGVLNNYISTFDINDLSVKKLFRVNTNYLAVSSFQNQLFYYVANKQLNTYSISNNIHTVHHTHYIDVDSYSIVDLNNGTHVVTTQIHTCVCIYGINSDRTKCFVGHFSPQFKNPKGVIQDLKTQLGDQYHEMSINILGGYPNNNTYKYFLNILPDNKQYNPEHHVLKPYSIIVSKEETVII